MANYLFITNSSNFCIDFKIIDKINEFIKINLNSNYTFSELSPRKAYEWKIDKQIINKVKIKNLKSQFSSLPIDLNFLKIKEPRKKKLLIADMDGTIIKEESLDEIAKLAGLEEKVEKITTKAMNGNIDFNKALIQRVELLKYVPFELIIKFKQNLNFSKGSKELILNMKKNKAKTVLVSGGFLPIVNHVAKYLKFDFCHGNEFIYKKIKNGQKILSGKIQLPILNSNTKLKLLKVYQKNFKLSTEDIIAIGDGANDIEMLKYAGIGVSYKGKDILQKNADIIFNHTDLRGILYIQGIRDSEIKSI